MIETRLTPSHPNTLKPLLDQPLTGTFNHARTERKLLLLKVLIVDVAMVTLKIGLDLEESRQRLASE